MMTNDNIEVVHQHQIVVAWIRLRQTRKLKEAKQTVNLPQKYSKLFLIKSSSNNENNKDDINDKINNNEKN